MCSFELVGGAWRCFHPSRFANNWSGSLSTPQAVLRLSCSLPATFGRCNKDFKWSAHVPRRVLTQDPAPAGNGGLDNAQNDLLLAVNDVLGGPPGRRCVPQSHNAGLAGAGWLHWPRWRAGWPHAPSPTTASSLACPQVPGARLPGRRHLRPGGEVSRHGVRRGGGHKGHQEPPGVSPPGTTEDERAHCGRAIHAVVASYPTRRASR